MTVEGVEDSDGDKVQVRQKSLLEKYEIPIDHLSYEYVQACTSVKELERIVKILRSGEEGYFPDLQKTSEERLSNLSPNNRLLRTEAPALDRSCFNKREWGDILDDMGSWKKEVSVRDKQLCSVDECEVAELKLPPVRQTFHSKQSSEGVDNQTKRKVIVSDYAFWDRYDVDTELLKIDLEEERKTANATEKNAEKKQKETNRLHLVIEEAHKCTETEKKTLAEQEKIRGNEYYQAKDYVEAEKYYTVSIAIYPTAQVYNNRASCHLKSKKYSEAIRDADSTLKLEPNNFKALYRKGIALKHTNKNQEALEMMEVILKQEPNNSQAQNVAKQLTCIISSQNKMRDFNRNMSDGIRNQIISTTEIKCSPDSRSCFEVNEWGLPKVLCRCFGVFKCNVSEDKITPQYSYFPRSKEKKSEPVRIIELPDEDDKQTGKISKRLEIIEIDTFHNEPLKKFSVPNKCKVVDKRTQKGLSAEHGGGDVISKPDY